jgi:hypothetical protein
MSSVRTVRLLVAGMIAAVAMSCAVAGQASASRGLAVTNGVALWFAEGNVNVNLGGVNTMCTWRVGMIPQQLISKTTLAEIARVQLSEVGGSRIANCNPVITGLILNDIVIGYIGFNGTLPNINAILGRANQFRFSYFIQALNLTCLFRGPLSFTFNRAIATGLITSVTINGVLPRDVTSPGVCPANANVNGNLNVQLPAAPVIQLV